MKSSQRLLGIGMVLLLALQASVSARENTAAFLPEGSVDAEKVIGSPPASDSEKFREQMAIVLWLQETRTPEQVEFVLKEVNLERFAPLIAPELLEVDGRALRETLDRVFDEVRADYDRFKAAYDVPRPFVANKEVHPVMDARPVASYPSGHAIRATVTARLLAAMFPERQEELLELAVRISYGRVIAGVHYPMDVVAGMKLGNAYADVILEQPVYRASVEAFFGKAED